MKASLRTIRQELKLSQSELAAAARVTPSQLKRWERNLEQVPREAMDNLAAALGKSVRELKRCLIDDSAEPEIGEGYVTNRSNTELILPRRSEPPARRT